MARHLISLTAAFLIGVVGTYVALSFSRSSEYNYERTSLEGHKTIFESIAKTAHWDVLTPVNSSGREVALGQRGAVRVVVLDDGPSLYVLTYKNKDSRLYDGRLMDIGNDGTIEVANITGGQCELAKQ
jgi:hypothetical protein